MKEIKKVVTIGVRMEIQLKEALELLAAETNRTLSDYIRLELQKIVKSKNQQS